MDVAGVFQLGCESTDVCVFRLSDTIVFTRFFSLVL